MDKRQLYIGEKIRQRRMIKGYSQEYMAFQLEISQNAYSKIEREETEMTVNRLYEIAEVLGVSVYEFLPDSSHGTILSFEKIKKYWHKFTGLFRKKKISQ
ncbi:MAG TPA: helix-turn-helix transcriptional regulator [Puia sp.]|jgi:transcriptional regulator with XRE-family HTH domain|nr:helix-turn-helix transcriptional regulator [Puia sp.]